MSQVNFTVIKAEQRSDAWFQARAGRVTGSKASCVLMGETTAGRNDYLVQLALERLTGRCEEGGYVSAEMTRGIEKEPLARIEAEARIGAFIRETGFCQHNALMIGTSLDGDSEEFECLYEFKCPKSTTHIKYLESGGAELVKDYKAQLMHSFYVTGAQRCIAASFDDRMPDGLTWVQLEVFPKDLPMEEYEKSLMKFLADVNSMECKLMDLMKKAA